MKKVSLLVAGAALAFLVCASSPAARADTGIAPLDPRPGAHVQTSTPEIVAQLPANGSRAYGRGDVTVVLDGRDVSDAAVVADGRVRYVPAAPLASGEHAVEIDVADTSGGRSTYQWTFSVDGTSPAETESSAGGVLPLRAAPTADASGAYASSGDWSGQGFSSFYALNPAPFYAGDGVRFVFVGVPGGFGFVTFAGIPGFFNLIPLGFDTYYVLVPIPVGFGGSNPFVACHFFPPVGAPVVVPYPHHLVIVGHRKPWARSPLRSTLALRFADRTAAARGPSLFPRPSASLPSIVHRTSPLRMLLPLPAPRMLGRARDARHAP
jgi:hypothetical protein